MATYNTLTPELIELLKQAAPGHLLTGEDINEDYSHDEMPIYGGHVHRRDCGGHEDMQ